MTKVWYTRIEGEVLFTFNLNIPVRYRLKILSKVQEHLGHIHSLILQDGNRWDEINNWNDKKLDQETMAYYNQACDKEPEIYKEKYVKTQ